MRRAVIIGGGPGGLAAALAVRRAGFTPVVCEAAAELREVGSGLTLWPNALRALDALGVGEAVRAAAASSPFRGIAMNRYCGERMFFVPCGGPDGIGWAAAIHRAELQSLLVEAVGRPAIRLDRRCVDVSQDGGTVTARFDDGELITGELLVGADGLHSRVRPKLSGPDELRRAGYRVWRGIAGFELSDRIGVTSLGRGAQFGMFPMSHGRTYWFASLGAVPGEAAVPHPAAYLGAQLAAWHAPVARLIAATDECSIVCTEIFDRKPLQRWSRGRITLLGDAAHPSVPTLGQGACQAFEDAAVLGSCLAHDPDVAGALLRYQHHRVRRANAISEASRWVGQAGQWRHPAACSIRDWLIQAIPESVRRRQLQSMFRYEP
jgi:2-polyprenyl-6-methoxyphenol hydroxylase-like FAD-dependent oxidoreductase